jgi:hypothetical protein
MKAYLERRKLLFKTKNRNKQPASSSSDWGGDEWHNIVEGGRTHNGDAEVANLVKEHLQT